MTEQFHSVERQVRILVLEHRKSDLLMAISYDLPGLMIPGRSEGELIAKIPRAIQEILEAQGHEVLSVGFAELGPNIPEDFVPPAHIVDALVRLAQ